jgi:transposase
MRPNDRGHQVLAAAGYAFERACEAPDEAEDATTWRARVLVLRSPMQADQQAVGLAKRLGHAETKLAALTPPRGRGKRPMTDEATLVAALGLVLKEPRVDGWLSVPWAKQVEQPTRYGGRGRGAGRREQRVIEQTRSHIPHSARQGDTIAALRQRLGWQAFVTKATPTPLSLQAAVLCDRHAYRGERICNRLKSHVHIAPLFVKLNDPIEGLTSLRTLGGRVLTVRACVLRRSLQPDHTQLPGLHPENKTKRTDKPTAERILQACADVSLTIITHAIGEEILRRLTSLSGLHEDILQRLGLGAALYGQLEIQGMGN